MQAYAGTVLQSLLKMLDGVTSGSVCRVGHFTENFFKTVSFVNNLKLRYSWAKLGSTSNVDAKNPFDLYVRGWPFSL
jgi:hypothetical protein